jgi:hypothetical protein
MPRLRKRAVVEIHAKVPPDDAWQESENWWVETTKYYGAKNPYVFKGPSWVLVADFPDAEAAARFTGMLSRAAKRVKVVGGRTMA